MDKPRSVQNNSQAFYDRMFNQCQPAEAVRRYGGAGYMQHSHFVGDGKEAFIEISRFQLLSNHGCSGA
jgi:predicted SnoaL-like aldol condensation-catalyzing enzyme